MKTVHRPPALAALGLVTCLVILAGCTDAPLEPEATPPPGSDAAAFAAIGIEAADLAGVDAAALARAIDLETVAGLLQEAASAASGSAPPAAQKDGPSRIAVSENGSIQAAIDAADPGDVVLVWPGVYREALTIDKPLYLLGLGGPKNVVIENPGAEQNGITVRDTRSVIIANLSVRGFEDNGIFAVRIDGLLLLRTDAVDNGEYGLFPVLSQNVIIAHSSASGSADAGHYVGQSVNTLVIHNVAYENVVGIEIENCVRTLVTHNKAYNNTAGMLAVLLPPSRFITFLEASALLVAHNHFTDNNLENFAEPGGLVSVVPAGSGLLVIGYNETLVTHNLVSGNQFVGIGVGSTATFGAIAGIPITGIEPDPDDVQVVQNVLKQNGGAASPLPFPAVDLLWDGTGRGNCWEGNVFRTSFPSPLPACQAAL